MSSHHESPEICKTVIFMLLAISFSCMDDTMILGKEVSDYYIDANYFCLVNTNIAVSSTSSPIPTGPGAIDCG